MKKKLLLLLITLSFPINVFAYSKYIIPGGENVGIEIKYDGVVIIGFYEVNNKYNDEELKVGDIITKVNGNSISNINDLISTIEKYKEDKKVNLTIIRNKKEKEVSLELLNKNNEYKTGLYVKDSISGIGTLSYIDPESKIYGALGHEIIDNQTKNIVDIKTGSIYESNVTSIDKSRNGEPGSKNASINKSNNYGSIEKNTNHGIFGKFDDIKNKELIEVGEEKELKKGEATILTVLDNDIVKSYKINITKIDYKHSTKNIYFEITDPELLNKTGGVVQGMSGSPIIQDGKIYGAVTHVVIESVNKGYGVFITTMLTEGERQE